MNELYWLILLILFAIPFSSILSHVKVWGNIIFIPLYSFLLISLSLWTSQYSVYRKPPSRLNREYMWVLTFGYVRGSAGHMSIEALSPQNKHRCLQLLLYLKTIFCLDMRAESHLDIHFFHSSLKGEWFVLKQLVLVNTNGRSSVKYWMWTDGALLSPLNYILHSDCKDNFWSQPSSSDIVEEAISFEWLSFYMYLISTCKWCTEFNIVQASLCAYLFMQVDI